MQKSTDAARSQHATTSFSTSNFFGGISSLSKSRSSSRSRQGTASADPGSSSQQQRQRNVLTKDRERRPSFSSSRRPSFSSIRPSSSASRLGDEFESGQASTPVTADRPAIPPLPEIPRAFSAKLTRGANTPLSAASTESFSMMLARSNTAGLGGSGATLMPTSLSANQGAEQTIMHSHITEVANKRISTLDYLRKAHEGRIYWFNTLLFDKPDLARMPYFDPRKVARRATNYLILGLSLPTVADLNSSTPTEFLRSLNTLLSEFDAFQQLHTGDGSAAGGLSRARLPKNMFRRATTGTRGRRSASNDVAFEPFGDLNGFGGDAGGGGESGGSIAAPPASVINFAASETDLYPGEEYTHLLTPSLPFEPDFFETFATLCDVLIDIYNRLLNLMPTPRECSGTVAELFTKVDGKVRKLLVQNIVKEFEESSRAGLKAEVANVGKVVLGGLM